MMMMIANLHARRKFCALLNRGTKKQAKGGEPHHSQGQTTKDRAENKGIGIMTPFNHPSSFCPLNGET
eukprot:4655700-Karenia_brevis.AAC.1